MGGHEAGDIASQMIVESLADLPAASSFDERVLAVRQCLHWINRRLGQELTVSVAGQARVIGSTVVTLLLDGRRGACVWAGDSRCYLWRGQRLYQLTRDHSLQQQLMDQQSMSAEQAREHPSARALTAPSAPAPASPWKCWSSTRSRATCSCCAATASTTAWRAAAWATPWTWPRPARPCNACSTPPWAARRKTT
jgi:hypothetical protein